MATSCYSMRLCLHLIMAAYLFNQLGTIFSAEAKIKDDLENSNQKKAANHDHQALIERTSQKLSPKLLTKRAAVESDTKLSQIVKRETVYQLGGEFLQLFDELWKMNNRSMTLLFDLGQDQGKVQHREQETRITWSDKLASKISTTTNNVSTTDTSGPTTEKPEEEAVKSTESSVNTTTEVVVAADSNSSPEPEFNSQTDSERSSETITPDPTQHLKHTTHNYHYPAFYSPTKQQPTYLSLVVRFKLWARKVHLKIINFFSHLGGSFKTRSITVQAPPLHQATTIATEKQEVRSPTRVPAPKSLDSTISDDQVRQLEKRHVAAQQLEEQPRPTNITKSDNHTISQTSKTMNLTETCIELDSGKLNECRSVETVLKANLTGLFPGTLPLVKENCERISFLLTNCWPEYLEYIRVLAGDWNATVQSTSDFPLPPRENQNAESVQQTSCGTSPQEALPIMDRIYWMWLNLCMDKRFRLEYLDNIKCLAAWGHDRAHKACGHEWDRMQDYFSRKATAKYRNNLAPVPAKLTTSGSETVKTSNGTSVSNRPQESSSSEKDLETKTGCCAFDMFLRCIHRQSIRDCGRVGSQFVVNFMARVGTEDMKYMCRRELKSANRSEKQASRRNNSDNNDRHPFIEAIYCADPRVQAALYETKNEDKVRLPGASDNVTPKPLINRNDNRGPALTLFGSGSSSRFGSFQKSALFFLSIFWLLFVEHFNIILVSIPLYLDD